MKPLPQLVFVFVIVVLSIALVTEGRPTSAVKPAPINSAESVYLTEMYYEDFDDDDYDDYHWIKDDPDSIIEVANNYLKIDADVDVGRSAGKNEIRTRCLNYERDGDQCGELPLYTIETTLYIPDVEFRWMRVIDNGDVIIFIETDESDNDKACIYYYDNDSEERVCSIYHWSILTIFVEVWDDETYDIHVDRNHDGNFGIEETKIPFSLISRKGYCAFGDRSPDSRGKVQWYNFILNGRISDMVKFHENFNDGNANDWHLVSQEGVYDPDPPAHYDFFDDPDFLSLQETSDESTEIDDFRLQFEMEDQADRAFALSPYFDLVRASAYTISFDFSIRGGGNFDWFILISDRNEVCVFIDDVANDPWLRAYTYDPIEEEMVYEDIMELEFNEEYYIQLVRSGNQYQVKIDLDYEGTYYVYNDPTNITRFKIGDFSPYDEYDEVWIDNIMLTQSREVGSDLDGDDITDDFEDQPFCPIFYEDFEYDLPFEEYGWQHVIFNGEGDFTIWDVDNPVVGQGDPDYGITYGLSGDGPVAQRSRLLGTNIGGTYPEMNIQLKSPIIFIPDGKELNDCYTIEIFIWMWWDFEEDVDGGRVRIEYFNPPIGPTSFILTPTTEGGYPSQAVSELGNNPGYTGESDSWVLQKFIVTDDNIQDRYIRLVFETNTDDVNDGDTGWYIDNIRMYSSMVTSAGADDESGFDDMDNDGLNDSEEFYFYGTSPMVWDSDFDAISDFNETLDICEFGTPFGGDPQVRNVFVEIDWYFNAGTKDKNHRPDDDNLEDIQELFEAHDIWIFFDLDDGIDADDTDISDLTLAFWDGDNPNFNFEDDHATPGVDDTITLTTERQFIWHYCLFAHEDHNDVGYYGQSRFNQYHFVVYNDNIKDDFDPTQDELDASENVFVHELGHNFGFFDYDNDDGYNNPPGTPPDSCLNHDRDRTDAPDYLGDESNVWYDCQVDHTGDYYWGNTIWRYGGWEYARTDDGLWLGGIDFRSVENFW